MNTKGHRLCLWATFDTFGTGQSVLIKKVPSTIDTVRTPLMECPDYRGVLISE